MSISFTFVWYSFICIYSHHRLQSNFFKSCFSCFNPSFNTVAYTHFFHPTSLLICSSIVSLAFVFFLHPPYTSLHLLSLFIHLFTLTVQRSQSPNERSFRKSEGIKADVSDPCVGIQTNKHVQVDKAKHTKRPALWVYVSHSTQTCTLFFSNWGKQGIMFRKSMCVDYVINDYCGCVRLWQV